MYQARLHPEQYSNTFSDEQIKRLYDAMMYVCDTAVELLAESDKFPADWLMKHRWTKGKKEQSKLPTGEKITFLTVGGRTSAIVPSLQKKTAAVAGDISEGTEEGTEEAAKPKKGGKRKVNAVKEEEDEEVEEAEEKASAKPKRARKKAEKMVKEETNEEPEEETPHVVKKQKKTVKGAVQKEKKAEEVEVEIKSEDTSGRRRSGRLAK
jgi:outer membrane biosynthesis protein TonB